MVEVNDRGVHEECGHATEAHGPEGCVQPGCECTEQRIVEDLSASNGEAQHARVEAPTAAAEGSPTE